MANSTDTKEAVSSPNIKYNTDLALFSYEMVKNGKAQHEECLPPVLEVGNSYSFIKKGHRTYQVPGEVTLLEMKPHEVLFELRAEVIITSISYNVVNNQSYTVGTYEVLEVLTS